MRPTNGPSRGYYLDNVSFETARNDALVGTVARSGGSARISKACNKDRPLQTIKARLPFLYLEYLSSDPSEKTEYPYRICVRIVPQGESYNFIGPLRGDSFQQGVVASPLKLLPTWVTSIFYLVGIESEHVREEFLRLISLLLRALLGDGEINLGWTFLRDLWWEVRVSSRAIFSSFRIGVMIFTSNRNWFW